MRTRSDRAVDPAARIPGLPWKASSRAISHPGFGTFGVAGSDRSDKRTGRQRLSPTWYDPGL